MKKGNYKNYVLLLIVTLLVPIISYADDTIDETENFSVSEKFNMFYEENEDLLITSSTATGIFNVEVADDTCVSVEGQNDNGKIFIEVNNTSVLKVKSLNKTCTTTIKLIPTDVGLIDDESKLENEKTYVTTVNVTETPSISISDLIIENEVNNYKKIADAVYENAISTLTFNVDINNLDNIELYLKDKDNESGTKIDQTIINGENTLKLNNLELDKDYKLFITGVNNDKEETVIKSDEIEIPVEKYYEPTNIVLSTDKDNATYIFANKNLPLKINHLVKNMVENDEEIVENKASIQDVLWESSDKNVATIDEDGLVTFTGLEGTTKIKAISKVNDQIEGSIDLKFIEPTVSIDDLLFTQYESGTDKVSTFDDNLYFDEFDTKITGKINTHEVLTKKLMLYKEDDANGIEIIPEDDGTFEYKINANEYNGNTIKIILIGTQTADDGEVTINTDEKKYTINKLNPITEITLPESLTITKKKDYSLSPVVTYKEQENSSFDSISYKSSDEDVATIENGIIKPLKTGETKITVTSKFNKVIAEINVTIVELNLTLDNVSIDNTGIKANNVNKNDYIYTNVDNQKIEFEASTNIEDAVININNIGETTLVASKDETSNKYTIDIPNDIKVGNYEISIISKYNVNDNEVDEDTKSITFEVKEKNTEINASNVIFTNSVSNDNKLYNNAINTITGIVDLNNYKNYDIKVENTDSDSDIDLEDVFIIDKSKVEIDGSFKITSSLAPVGNYNIIIKADEEVKEIPFTIEEEYKPITELKLVADDLIDNKIELKNTPISIKLEYLPDNATYKDFKITDQDGNIIELQEDNTFEFKPTTTGKYVFKAVTLNEINEVETTLTINVIETKTEVSDLIIKGSDETEKIENGVIFHRDDLIGGGTVTGIVTYKDSIEENNKLYVVRKDDVGNNDDTTQEITTSSNGEVNVINTISSVELNINKDGKFTINVPSTLEAGEYCVVSQATNLSSYIDDSKCFEVKELNLITDIKLTDEISTEYMTSGDTINMSITSTTENGNDSTYPILNWSTDNNYLELANNTTTNEVINSITAHEGNGTTTITIVPDKNFKVIKTLEKDTTKNYVCSDGEGTLIKDKCVLVENNISVSEDDIIRTKEADLVTEETCKMLGGTYIDDKCTVSDDETYTHVCDDKLTNETTCLLQEPIYNYPESTGNIIISNKENGTYTKTTTTDPTKFEETCDSNYVNEDGKCIKYAIESNDLKITKTINIVNVNTSITGNIYGNKEIDPDSIYSDDGGIIKGLVSYEFTNNNKLTIIKDDDTNSLYEGDKITISQNFCPSGYMLEEVEEEDKTVIKCVKEVKETVDATPTCPDGTTLVDGKCILKEETSLICDNGVITDERECKSVVEVDATEDDETNTYSCPDETYTLTSDNKCVKETVTSPICPNEYTQIDNECVKETEKDYDYICPDGTEQTDDATKCLKTSYDYQEANNVDDNGNNYFVNIANDAEPGKYCILATGEFNTENKTVSSHSSKYCFEVKDYVPLTSIEFTTAINNIKVNTEVNLNKLVILNNGESIPSVPGLKFTIVNEDESETEINNGIIKPTEAGTLKIKVISTKYTDIEPKTMIINVYDPKVKITSLSKEVVYDKRENTIEVNYDTDGVTEPILKLYKILEDTKTEVDIETTIDDENNKIIAKLNDLEAGNYEFKLIGEVANTSITESDTKQLVIKESKIVINNQPTKMITNKTFDLDVTYEANQDNLEYSSSDNEIATIAETGTIKALKAGNVIITITEKDNDKVKETFELLILDPIVLDIMPTEINAKEAALLTGTLEINEGTYTGIKFVKIDGNNEIETNIVPTITQIDDTNKYSITVEIPDTIEAGLYNLIISTTEAEYVQEIKVIEQNKDVDIFTKDDGTKSKYILNKGNYITNVEIKLSEEEFLSELNLNDVEYELTKAITSSNYVGSGTTLKINPRKDNEIIYTVIIFGDVNGDGDIQANDYMMIKNSVLSKTNSNINDPLLNNKVRTLSADVKQDNTIQANDYMMIKNCVLSRTNSNITNPITQNKTITEGEE